MKKFLLLTALSVFGLHASLFAQAKFGHLNSMELISAMPETKAADSVLMKYGQSLENQLKAMSAEYQSKMSDYQTQMASMADAVRQIKEREILDLQQRIQDFRESAQESIERKKEDLYAPILKKANDAIQAVAKEGGYSYIFDTSTGVVLFAVESEDVSNLIRKKLGIKPVEPAAPATAPKK